MLFVHAHPPITSGLIDTNPSTQPIGNHHSNIEGAYVDTCDSAYYKMREEIHRLFPEGLKHVEAEQWKPQHDLPLRFVPPKVSEKEDGKDTRLKLITIVLDQDMTQKVCLYNFDDIETFLRMQINHAYLLAQ